MSIGQLTHDGVALTCASYGEIGLGLSTVSQKPPKTSQKACLSLQLFRSKSLV